MAHDVPPTPLGLRRRFDLLVARVIAVLLAAVDKLRRHPEPPAPITEHRYGPHPRETLQLIPPKPEAPRRTPIVFIHGGGWIIMDSRLWTRELIDFASHGYPVFNVEYPLAPERPHPLMLRSLLQALGFIRERHPEVDRVHLMGDSAGGNLVMMLALFSANPELLQDLGPGAPSEVPLRVQSVVPLYGIIDRTTSRRNRFPGIDLMMEAYGGREALEDEVARNKAITPMDLEFDACPPCFLVAGAKDRLADGTRALEKRMSHMPIEMTCKVYEGERHGFFSMPWRPRYAELRRDIFAFLDKHESAARAEGRIDLAEARQ
jgi:acetyl esterase